ncbi:MAG: hypothetical protein U0667_17495 [Chloroflexota bacterium]
MARDDLLPPVLAALTISSSGLPYRVELVRVIGPDGESSMWTPLHLFAMYEVEEFSPASGRDLHGLARVIEDDDVALSASQKLRDGVELRDTTSSGTAARHALLELFQVIEEIANEVVSRVRSGWTDDEATASAEVVERLVAVLPATEDPSARKRLVRDAAQELRRVAREFLGQRIEVPQRSWASARRTSAEQASSTKFATGSLATSDHRAEPTS